MNLALLPSFGGELHEPWQLHEVRLLAWLRIHQIPDHEDKTRLDFLVLSLKPNSSPLDWFVNQPSDLKKDFSLSLKLLQDKYGNDLRKEMHMISAMNCLEVRSFRDNEHKTEMVFELINELEQLLTCASLHSDSQKREYLLRCFRGFSGAHKMMNRTTSYDSAVLAALNWEASVISKAEEAMIRAVMKRQPGQKSQNARPRTKRDSDPANHSIDHQPIDRPHEFIPQDFKPNPDSVCTNPDAYYKARLLASQPHPQKSSHENYSDPKAFQTSTASAAAYVTPGTRDDTDPSQMMESLVDPHLLARQSPRRLNRILYQNSSHPHLAQMNQESQEVMDDSKIPTPQPQKFKVKPLVYDAQKNPYPPPEQLPENKLRNQHTHLEPSHHFPLPQHPLDNHGPNFPMPGSQDLDRSKRYQSAGKNTTHPSQTTSIPFPSPQARYQPLPGPSSARRSPVPPTSSGTHQSNSMLIGSSSSQRGTVFFDSTTNLHSNTGSLRHQSITMPELLNGKTQTFLKRRPSKLVKLRRKGSGSTNNSNSSTGSFHQVRNFIGALNKRAGRSSQSGDESDSTQDHGPNTPSSLEPGAGASGSGVDSEGNERLRPMQAQFYRLFRKHNHPEHLRRENRAMLYGKPSPSTQKPAKGKSRAVDIHLTPAGADGSHFYQGNQPSSNPRSRNYVY